MFAGEKARISERWSAPRFAKYSCQREGDFAAWEQTAVFVDELRATFRTFR